MAQQPSPRQLERCGHIAKAINNYLEKSGIGPAEFQKQLDLPKNTTAVYAWKLAKSAPPVELRPKISKLTGIPIEQLTPTWEGTTGGAQPRSGKKKQTPTEVIEHIEAMPEPRKLIGRMSSAETPLSFQVLSNGECRIRLDITLPVEQGAPLLRMLLDAGIVYGTKQENNG
jgi:hypothetical protein